LPVVYTIEAEGDLVALEEYLAQRFSFRNAAAYIERIQDFCDALALSPHRGTRRDDLDAEVRTIGFERRVRIVFEVEAKRVLILGIFYGGRQFS
jgi:toxin ParE1/3/4